MRKPRTSRRARPLGFDPLEARALMASLPAGFAEAVVASGLTAPTAMELAPDGRLFIAEQAGTMEVFQGGTRLQANFFRDTPLTVNSAGERGLLGVALDPQFATNRFVYAYYTAITPTIHNRLSRFTADASGTLALAGSETVLLDVDPLTSATNHNGGAIHFGPDGKLYVAVGDNATGANAQTLANLKGKILRLNADGSIPADNPFFATATGKNRAIWALGLRNPFTFAFQPGSSRMFINDVGQSTFEEINAGAAGANYGWPATEGPTTDPRFVAPFFAYGRSEGQAIAGGAFYNPAVNRFPADHAGDYFFADFVASTIRRIDPETKAVNDFATDASFPVDLRVGDDGGLYYLSRGLGQVLRVDVPNAPGQAPTIARAPESVAVAPGTPAMFSVAVAGTAPFTYQWQRDGVNIVGATSPIYTLAAATAADNGRTFRVVVANTFGAVASPGAVLTVAAATDPAAGFAVKVNFQPAGVAAPAGYLADSGAVFGARAGLLYGWSRRNALSARVARRIADARFATSLALGPRLRWEIAAPDGVYAVRIVAGGLGRAGEPVRLGIEGQPAVQARTTRAEPWIDRTRIVIVRDGRLTLAATGARATRINFVEIARLGPLAS